MSKWTDHRRLGYLCLAVLVALLIGLPAGDVWAHKGHNSSGDHCHTLSGDLCWVSDENTNSRYYDPRIRVHYKTLFIPATPVTAEVSVTNDQALGVNECKWFFFYSPVPLLRVCARMVEPGQALYPGMDGYDPDSGPGKGNNAPYDHHGNDTGLDPQYPEGCTSTTCGGSPGLPSYPNANPRTQICAFEDPCDFSDPPDGLCIPGLNNSSPFDWLTSRAAAINATNAAQAGLMAGVMIGGATGVFVAGMSAALTVFLPYYNYLVVRDLGCVDVPLADFPPTFTNDAWKLTYQPMPEILRVATSTFTTPKVQVRVCKDSATNKITKCGPGLTVVTKEIITLQPDRASGFTSCVAATTPDMRTFCAKISTDRPDKICVFRQETPPAQDKLVGCVPRDGYMPWPIVNSYGSGQATPAITVKQDNAIVTLRDDPGLYQSPPVPNANWTQNCAYLNQIQFCAYRQCATYGAAPMDYAPKACATYNNQVCVTGYIGKEVVAVDGATNVPIAGLPNSYNTTVSAWMYNPPACLQRNMTVGSPTFGRCTHYAPCLDATPPLDPTMCTNFNTNVGAGGYNYAGQCCVASGVDESVPDARCPGVPLPYRDKPASDPTSKCLQYIPNTTTDNYYVDTTVVAATPTVPAHQTRFVRPLSSEELGLCVAVPVPWDVRTPGTYTYTVPPRCTRLRVSLIAGGGGGFAYEDGDGAGCYEHFAGGQGAYGEWYIPITTGIGVTPPSFTVTVGGGGYYSYSGGDRDWFAPRIRGGSSSISYSGPSTPLTTTGSSITVTGGYSQWLGDNTSNGGTLGAINWPNRSVITQSNGAGGGCNTDDGVTGPGGGTDWTVCWGQPQGASGTPGSGGCSHDGDSPSSWGLGAAGRAYIICDEPSL